MKCYVCDFEKLKVFMSTQTEVSIVDGKPVIYTTIKPKIDTILCGQCGILLYCAEFHIEEKNDNRKICKEAKFRLMKDEYYKDIWENHEKKYPEPVWREKDLVIDDAIAEAEGA